MARSTPPPPDAPEPQAGDPSRRRCAAITKAGARCKKTPMRDGEWCNNHGHGGDGGTLTRARVKEAFLEAFGEHGIVTAAAEAVGVARSRVYKWAQEDAEFAEKFREASEREADVLEAVARTRAIDGDTPLLMFLLKAKRPEKYRERIDSRVSVAVRDEDVERMADLIGSDPEKLALVESWAALPGS